MRTHFIVLILAATLPVFADPADDQYRLGLAAKERGDVAAAHAAFLEVLRLKPSHPYARFELGRLQSTRGDLVARKRTTELAAVRIAEIDLNSVPFSEALEALATLIEAASPNKEGEAGYSPNFVIKDPTGALGRREVTLQLKNVPAKVVLDYMLEQVGARAKYEEYAIAIDPASRPAVPAGNRQE